jgi:hypothetical protein
VSRGDKQFLITEVIPPSFCSDFVTRVVLSVRAKTAAVSLNVEAPEKTYWLRGLPANRRLLPLASSEQMLDCHSDIRVQQDALS